MFAVSWYARTATGIGNLGVFKRSRSLQYIQALQCTTSRDSFGSCQDRQPASLDNLMRPMGVWWQALVQQQMNNSTWAKECKGDLQWQLSCGRHGASLKAVKDERAGQTDVAYQIWRRSWPAVHAHHIPAALPKAAAAVGAFQRTAK